MSNVRIHIAIIAVPYDRLILDGRKVIEARLTKTPMPPFGVITPGDRIHFKQSGGPFFALATAARVLAVDALTPKLIDQLRNQYDQWICGEPAYWQSKRDAKFATLIWLREVRPSSARPNYKPQNMRAWYTLTPGSEDAAPGSADASPPAADNSFAIPLTDGAIRQNYVRVGAYADRFKGVVELRLAAGPTVQTEITRGMFRWRGWGEWFAAHQLKPGDRLQFTPAPGSPRSFDVTPVRMR